MKPDLEEIFERHIGINAEHGYKSITKEDVMNCIEEAYYKHPKSQVFDLGWSWHEDWSSYLFIHINKTKDQFKEDVKSLLIKYGKDYIKSEEEHWTGAHSWIEFISNKMEELGYEKVIPIRESFFGGYILEENDEESEKWGEIVGKDLLKEAIDHNKKVKEDMDERNKL